MLVSVNSPSRARRKAYRHNRELGMSKANAAIVAGYPRSLVEKHQISSPLRSSDIASTDFYSMFERKCMTDMKKVQFVIDGMNATRVVSLATDQKDSRGKTIYVEHEVPDWNARYKFGELMLRLCKQLENNQSNQNNNLFFLGSDFATKLKEARERASEEVKARSVIDVQRTDLAVERHS